MITSVGHPKSLTLFTKSTEKNNNNNNNNNDEMSEKLKQSSWVVTPYFMLYFTTYIINSLVWPLYVMERLCIETYTHPSQGAKFDLFHTQNTTKGSCISQYMATATSKVPPTTTSDVTNRTFHLKNNLTSTVLGIQQGLSNNIREHNIQINSETLNYMIVGSIIGAVLSLVSYFIIWKPVLRKCKALAVLLPPVCILCQCVLFSYSLTVNDTKTFKYVVLSGVILPCLHSNFQGIFLLMFELTRDRDNVDYTSRRSREITTVKIEGSYATVLLSMVMSGIMISFCFDMAYSVLFVLQFTMGLMTTLYGAMLIPFKDITCVNNDSDEEDGNRNDSDGKGNKEDGKWMKINGTEDEVENHFLDSSDEEEIYLMRKSQGKSDTTGLFGDDGSIFSEAPMIFSETSYRKELMIIVEIGIFTIALISDSMISGPYLLQEPFNLSVTEYGYCITIQGIAKIFGVFVVQTVAYFMPCKHGGLVIVGGLNIVLYYTLLGVVQDTYALYGVMVLNMFGGIIFPTIASFMKINFHKTLGLVLEISMISSLIVTVGFHGFEYYIYSVTRNLYPGSVFLLTAGLIFLGFMIASVTYFSTTIRNRRNTKEITDKLLNDYQ